MSHYIKMLQELARKSAAQPKPPTAHDKLKDRVERWHCSLPPVSRDRPFAMSEIEAALKTSGRYLSPILLELGWERRRRWASKTQYHRFWVPPNQRPSVI